VMENNYELWSIRKKNSGKTSRKVNRPKELNPWRCDAMSERDVLSYYLLLVQSLCNRFSSLSISEIRKLPVLRPVNISGSMRCRRGTSPCYYATVHVFLALTYDWNKTFVRPSKSVTY
jgi:hypothetical protein